MRLFYQIYYDGFPWMNDNTKVKILSTLQNELNTLIETLDKDSHQFIVRFRFADDKGREELKIGNNFIQVSSEISFERCKQIFDKIVKIIPIDNMVDLDELPF